MSDQPASSSDTDGSGIPAPDEEISQDPTPAESPPGPAPPPTLRQLLSNPQNETPYPSRLAQRTFPTAELRAEIDRMAPVVLTQMPNYLHEGSTPELRMMAGKRAKWVGLRAHPEWLDGAGEDLLKVLVADAYWDLEWVGGEWETDC
ncbi:hypothetical protein LTR53_013148 [Teratosphaeriaceae sp. CCFEE 6253]|nr:hypothetical protein LTR53_013148 [Teratosphaeriaceae sp. CCFEE 6253]